MKAKQNKKMLKYSGHDGISSLKKIVTNKFSKDVSQVMNGFSNNEHTSATIWGEKQGVTRLSVAV